MDIGIGPHTIAEENALWRKQDIKGRRRTQYIKEVTKKNDLI